MFFFFKQKTAYELRISDWSSDVCSSDLPLSLLHRHLRRFCDTTDLSALALPVVAGRFVGRHSGLHPARPAHATLGAPTLSGRRVRARNARAAGLVACPGRLTAWTQNALSVRTSDRKSTRLTSSHQCPT